MPSLSKRCYWRVSVLKSLPELHEIRGSVGDIPSKRVSHVLLIFMHNSYTSFFLMHHHSFPFTDKYTWISSSNNRDRAVKYPSTSTSTSSLPNPTWFFKTSNMSLMSLRAPTPHLRFNSIRRIVCFGCLIPSITAPLSHSHLQRPRLLYVITSLQ